MRFYTFMQNNSGGYFIRTETVNEAIIIEAASEEEAIEKFEELVEDHHEYCECCGERWSSYPDVNDTPMVFGRTPQEAWWTPVIHYANGEVKTFEK